MERKEPIVCLCKYDLGKYAKTEKHEKGTRTVQVNRKCKVFDI
jgi:hypothetical protein